jgi:hypothetical protein
MLVLICYSFSIVSGTDPNCRLAQRFQRRVEPSLDKGALDKGDRQRRDMKKEQKGKHSSSGMAFA